MPQPSLWKPLAAALVVAVITGALGGLLTRLGPWYYGLSFPPWKPPDWLFGPAWTTIYAFTVGAFVVAWRDATPAQHTTLLVLFLVNVALNIAWSGFFFTLRRPDFALVEGAFLWLSILVLVIVLWPWSRTASLLLLPYLAWVSFASALNASVVMRNGPFG